MHFRIRLPLFASSRLMHDSFVLFATLKYPRLAGGNKMLVKGRRLSKMHAGNLKAVA